MTAAPSFFGETCRLLCDSLVITGALIHHVVGFAMPPCSPLPSQHCSSPDNSSCHVWDYSACAWMRYLPSLRCLSHSLNATRNAFSDSFNSPDPVNLEIITQINRRHVEHVTLIQSRRCRISTTLLRSANPNSFRTDWILCLHDSLVTMPFLFISLSGIGSLELRAGVSRVSLQQCLSKSLGALRRCLYCMAFHMQITST